MTQAVNILADPLHALENLFGMRKYNIIINNELLTNSCPLEQYVSSGNNPADFDASKYVQDWLLQSDLELQKVRTKFAPLELLNLIKLWSTFAN
jgi:hypothetical protein